MEFILSYEECHAAKGKQTCNYFLSTAEIQIESFFTLQQKCHKK
jgi:hypothetical protein